MSEEHRDPELESARAEWSPPPPGPEFHARVLRAFDREFGGVPWWRRWPVAATTAIAAGLVAAFVIAPHFAASEKSRRYQPVRQPRFIIISQGEHP